MKLEYEIFLVKWIQKSLTFFKVRDSSMKKTIETEIETEIEIFLKEYEVPKDEV